MRETKLPVIISSCAAASNMPVRTNRGLGVASIARVTWPCLFTDAHIMTPTRVVEFSVSYKTGCPTLYWQQLMLSSLNVTAEPLLKYWMARK